MQVVVHQGKTRALDCKDSHQLFEPAFNPLLAVPASFAAKKRAANASRDAVIPQCQSRVDEF
jgi:hypothetical protein